MDIIKWLELEENLMLYKEFEKVERIAKDREVVFLCVGNSKVWFDSFGPTMGSLLMHLDLEKFIYGNLRANITSRNIGEYVDMIYKLHIDPFIVVFDNALSKENVGLVVREGPIECAAFSENSTTVGDLSVIFNVTREFISSPDNCDQMRKAVKKVARFLHFALTHGKAAGREHSLLTIN